MKIDNAPRARKIRFVYLIVPILTAFIVTLIYFVFFIESVLYLIFALVGLVAFFTYMGLFQYRYIIFYAEADRLLIGYKRLSPFPSLNNRIEIKTQWFSGYELVETKRGFKKLILSQSTPNGLAKYNPISLSALTPEQIDKICKAMDLMLAIKKQTMGQ